MDSGLFYIAVAMLFIAFYGKPNLVESTVNYLNRDCAAHAAIQSQDK